MMLPSAPSSRFRIKPTFISGALGICLLSLGACADKPPINSFCAWFVPTDFTDAGIFKLSPDNKRVQIVNEDTRMRECSANGGGLTPGPR